MQSFIDSNSKYDNISATGNGGLMISANSSLKFLNVAAFNFSAYRGAAFYMEDSSNLQLTNCSFDFLYAVDRAGLIY